MRPLRAPRFSGTASLLSLALAMCVTATGQPDGQESLRGLSSIDVLVEPMSPLAEQNGLPANAIQTDAELKLRQAGIRVPVKPDFDVAGSPYLYIRVSVIENSGLVSYSIDISLNQWVFLARDTAVKVRARTWTTAGVGSVGRSNLRLIRDYVKDHVDEFINAYLSVNPKK